MLHVICAHRNKNTSVCGNGNFAIKFGNLTQTFPSNISQGGNTGPRLDGNPGSTLFPGNSPSDQPWARVGNNPGFKKKSRIPRVGSQGRAEVVLEGSIQHWPNVPSLWLKEQVGSQG